VLIFVDKCFKKNYYFGVHWLSALILLFISQYVEIDRYQICHTRDHDGVSGAVLRRFLIRERSRTIVMLVEGRRFVLQYLGEYQSQAELEICGCAVLVYLVLFNIPFSS
jgi:hypothetical protein